MAVKIAAFQEWKHSWKCQENSGHPTPANPETWKAASISMDQKTGRFRMNYREAPVQIHQNLSRAQSSIAMQIRSEHIGLNSYLYRRIVAEKMGKKLDTRYLCKLYVSVGGCNYV
jgi:hypothetical protein